MKHFASHTHVTASNSTHDQTSQSEPPSTPPKFTAPSPTASSPAASSSTASSSILPSSTTPSPANTPLTHTPPQPHPAFDEFVATIAALRAPNGCPWDKAQTHRSISSNMIEEAYEAVDAIEADDIPHLREELGDVLLQVVLQAQIAADANEFSIDDVCRDVNEKIIRRHPHVFGTAHADNPHEVKQLWDKVKLAEKQHEDTQDVTTHTAPEGLLDGVPKNFPALLQAQKISRKAAAAGFEWDTMDAVWQKVDEECAELKEVYQAAPTEPDGQLVADEDPSQVQAEYTAKVQMEFGDVLFALVNVGRKMGLDTETALRMSCNKFRQRWAYIEECALQQQRPVEDLSLEEMEKLWECAKAQEE